MLDSGIFIVLLFLLQHSSYVLNFLQLASELWLVGRLKV